MKRALLLTILLCSMALAAAPALAVSLTLIPSYQQVPVGGIASVDLVVSGLANNGPDSLGAFGVDIGYDASILSIAESDVVFGSMLGTPSFDPFDFFADATAFVDTSTIPGVVHLDETSWLDASVLDGLQPDSFTLATLSFTGTRAGFSGLDFLTADLSDAFGLPINSVNTAGAGIAPVPEPTTLILLGTGLAGLAGVRRKLGKS